MKILVINCGSSSLKFQLIDTDNGAVHAKGLCERIGIDGSRIVYTPMGKDKITREFPMPSHNEAIKIVLDSLLDKEIGLIKSMDEIGAVGHRIVHGGEHFKSSAVIDDAFIKAVEEVSDLAPLHNPANLIGINACRKLMPSTPMVGVFDTAFHQTMPEKAYLYGLSYDYYKKHKIRRYGFHGTSHAFVSKEAAKVAGLDINNSKIIVCHLGNGASLSAVLNGKSVDTSMGLTPLEGLIMGTRSGDLDPAILKYLADKENLNLEQVTDILNKKSGVLGLSEYSSDFVDLEKGFEKGDEGSIRAINAFCYRIAKYVGAYAAAMNGVDAIAFTAGIGENSGHIRAEICKYLGYLGLNIDAEQNKKRGENIIISTPDSKIKAMIIPTNEELAIAQETLALVK